MQLRIPCGYNYCTALVEDIAEPRREARKRIVITIVYLDFSIHALRHLIPPKQWSCDISLIGPRKHGTAANEFYPFRKLRIAKHHVMPCDDHLLSVTTSSKSSSSIKPILLLSFARRAPPRSIPGPTNLFFFSSSACASFAFCSSVFNFGLPGPRGTGAAAAEASSNASFEGVGMRGVTLLPRLSDRYASLAESWDSASSLVRLTFEESCKK